MNKFKKLMLMLGIVSTTQSFYIQIAQAATDTAQALQLVLAPIAIAQVSDLDFGSGFAGDPAKTVAPGAVEDAENASFAVSGAANTAYTITLPADGAVTMITGAGATANEQIGVNSFLSNPAAGANGLLDGTGNQDLFVGATRDALLATQSAGSYAATFTVDVVY